MLQLVSIELTNLCSKQCFFCYNGSNRKGHTQWTVPELVAFIEDLSANGIKAVSLGGGEPLEYPGLFQVLQRTKGLLFRSMTTNGLLLDKHDNFNKLVESQPEKVHVSLHFPENRKEVRRVLRHVQAIAAEDIIAGVNLLVRDDQLPAARAASDFLKAEGLTPEQIVYLPMKMGSPVSADMIRFVAGQQHFQSMSCLKACGKSERFCSISWDKRLAWCSYTKAKAPLEELNYQEVVRQLENLKLEYCG